MIVSLPAVFDAVIVTVQVPPAPAVTQVPELNATSPLRENEIVLPVIPLPEASVRAAVATDCDAKSAVNGFVANVRLRLAAAAAPTVIEALVPVTVASPVSVAVIVRVPEVRRIAVNGPVPVAGTRPESPGSVARESVLVNVTVPVYPVSVLP